MSCMPEFPVVSRFSFARFARSDSPVACSPPPPNETRPDNEDVGCSTLAACGEEAAAAGSDLGSDRLGGADEGLDSDVAGWDERGAELSVDVALAAASRVVVSRRVTGASAEDSSLDAPRPAVDGGAGPGD